MIIDAMQALEIMRELGYGKVTIDLLLKQRWYDRDGLITDEEWHTYCRLRTVIALSAYRKARHTNPVLAARLHANYLSWRKEL